MLTAIPDRRLDSEAGCKVFAFNSPALHTTLHYTTNLLLSGRSPPDSLPSPPPLSGRDLFLKISIATRLSTHCAKVIRDPIFYQLLPGGTCQEPAILGMPSSVMRLFLSLFSYYLMPLYKWPAGSHIITGIRQSRQGLGHPTL